MLTWEENRKKRESVLEINIIDKAAARTHAPLPGVTPQVTFI